MSRQQSLNLKFTSILWYLFGLNMLFVLWTLIYSSIIVCDDIEHMRAAYFISLGDVPYRDFFEHHHPLLWYVLWPLIKVLPRSTIISIYIGRALSVFISLGTGYYFYRIVQKFIGGKTVALLAIILYFTGMPSWYSIVNIKPDIYMRLFYFMGLYYLFSYFRYQKTKDLCLCGIAWMIGFLFLQTITLSILPLIIPVAYFLYRHPLKFGDFIKASVIPLLILGCFIGILYHADALAAYYELNWTFNNLMTGFLYHLTQTKYLLLFADSIFLSLAAIIIYFKYGRPNIYMLSLILLLMSELLQRVFWVSVFSQYYVMFFAFAAMVMAPITYKLWRRYPPISYVLIFYVFFHIIVNWVCLKQYEFQQQPFYYLEKHNVPLDQTYGLDCGIYQERHEYYWALVDVEAIHNILYRYDTKYDLNQLISNPKIRYYCASGTKRNQKILQRVDDLLAQTDEQKMILQRHVLNADFAKNYDMVVRRLYEKRGN